MIDKLTVAVIGGLMLFNEARAEGAGSNLDNAPGINLSIDGLMNIIKGLACWIVNAALILIVVAVVFYGIQFLISRGDPGKVGDARKALTWGVVGIIVILGAYTIIATVGYYIGVDIPNIALGC